MTTFASALFEVLVAVESISASAGGRDSSHGSFAGHRETETGKLSLSLGEAGAFFLFPFLQSARWWSRSYSTRAAAGEQKCVVSPRSLDDEGFELPWRAMTTAATLIVDKHAKKRTAVLAALRLLRAITRDRSRCDVCVELGVVEAVSAAVRTYLEVRRDDMTNKELTRLTMSNVRDARRFPSRTRRCSTSRSRCCTRSP